MSFGLGIKGALGGASQGASIGSVIPGIGTALGGAIGGGLGLLGGLFGGGNSTKDQEKLMEKAWEYEKEGMGMQYQYGQAAANAAQQRSMEMWNQTNFEAQRQHMENANLSVGLMYGGGGQGAVSQGGQATQPSGPTSNPVGMALQYKQIEQQEAAIKSQTMLNQAEAAKALAEAGKTAGPEYNKATWEAKNMEIENRIKTITEGITGSNLVEAEANAQKAVAEWNSAMAKAEVDQATKNTAIQTMKQNLINMQAEGALKIVGKDLSVAQARMIEREMQWLGYRATTERMSAEAAQKQAANTAEKIIKDYERSGQKLNIDEKNSLREWIYGGIKVLSSFIPGK